MTNKEAIKELKGLQKFINGTRLKGEIRVEALDLAIKALENSSWIPIKTRELTAEEKEENPDITFMWDCPLPDDAQDVLITTCWGDVKICTFCVDDLGSYFDEMDEDEVLAWMPLPEPYTKEDSENE